jgi:site-specific recombinase XerD
MTPELHHPEEPNDATGMTQAPPTGELPCIVLIGERPPPRLNPARAYLNTLRAKTSRETQERALVMILRELRTDKTKPPPSIDEFPWHGLRRDHARWIYGTLCHRKPAYGPATLRRLLTALRQVFHASWDLGYIDADTRDRCKAFPAIREEAEPTGVEVATDEVARLFAGCDPTTLRGARAIAALALLFGGGLRREEVTNVRMDSLDTKRGLVSVLGKGRRFREVPLGAWMPEINAWITLRSSAPGPLICRLGRWNKIDPARGITPSQLYNLLTQLGASLTPPVDYAPHDARRTLLTALLRKNVDMRFVQRLAGHKSINTTARYDMRGKEEMFAGIKAAGRVTIASPSDAQAAKSTENQGSDEITKQ